MSSLSASLDAIAQAELVRRGEVTPLDLVDSAIDVIARLNPELHAVIHPAFDTARDRARAGVPAGPLSGVPILMKDIGGAEAGRPNHAGMRLLKDAAFCEDEDSFFTRKLKAAGCISLGRTNTPELALLPITEPVAFGPTANPWCPTHSPGGSSGGSAAAVAAGMVAVAHGSDGGGSIRGPASMCGLVGLKPTRARTSFAPALGERWSGLSSEFVLTRSVRDCAAFLDATSGPAPGDPYFAPTPRGPFSDELLAEVGELRIGVLDHGIRGLHVDPECSTAARHAATTLEGLGHLVEQAYPQALDEAEHILHYAAVVACNTAWTLDSWSQRLDRVITREDVEPLTWALAEQARGLPAPNLIGTMQYVHGFGRRLASFWQTHDLLLTPTLGALPPELGSLNPGAEQPLQDWVKSAPYGMFTLPFNLSGQPAISLPLHWSEDSGMPVGVQLVAAAGREDLLLRVARQLEQAVPWAGKHPPLFG